LRAGSHSRLSPDDDSILFFDGMTQYLRVFSRGALRPTGTCGSLSSLDWWRDLPALFVALHDKEIE
jgi:hypothetical protein